MVAFGTRSACDQLAPVIEATDRQADEVRKVKSEPSIFDVVLNQRACRQFRDEPVNEELLERCLRAATHAPSAENLQPWVFVVVQEAQQRHALGELCRQAWERGGRAHSEDRLPADLFRDVDSAAQSGFDTAPVLIVVCGDSDVGLAQTLPSSVFPAAQNLLLAAAGCGLGAAMTTLATAFRQELMELLELPPNVLPLAVLPLGWPQRPLGPPKRIPFQEKTYRDRFSSPW